MSQPTVLRTIVGMPAYNESKYIGSLILQARQYADEVIVVDDGSSDRTATIAELAGVTVVRHGENRGYGAAIQSILSEARKRQPDVLVIMDADAQHDPGEIPSLVRAVKEGSDLVVGSRQIGRENIPAYRKIGQKVLTGLTGVLSKEKLSDTECGFRAYSRKAIAILNPKEKGMAISAEIISEAFAHGLKVTEIPVSAIYTVDGSSLSPVSHGLGVLNRIMAMISERRPLLFFGLAGGILAILGILAGIGVVTTYYSSSVLATGTALLSIMLLTIGILTIFTGLILNVLVKRISSTLEQSKRTKTEHN